LWCLRWVEKSIRQHRHATLNFNLEGGAMEEEIRSMITQLGFKIAAQAVSYFVSPPRRRLSWEVEWVSPASHTDPPDFLRIVAARPDVTELEWKEVPISPH
jgi:hypothetical protein